MSEWVTQVRDVAVLICARLDSEREHFAVLDVDDASCFVCLWLFVGLCDAFVAEYECWIV